MNPTRRPRLRFGSAIAWWLGVVAAVSVVGGCAAHSGSVAPPAGFTSQARQPVGGEPTDCGPGDLQFNTAKVIRAMRNEGGYTDDLTLIAAHRGYWEVYPENSWLAIKEAGFRCAFEIVEVDVKPAANQVPVVFHDFRLERATAGNGLLTNLTADEFTALSMRDRHGNVRPEIRPMTTFQFLTQFAAEMAARQKSGVWFGPVIAFDMKAAKVEDVWPMVRTVYQQMKDIEGRRADESLHGIVFKVEARSMPSTAQAVEDLRAGSRVPLNITVVLNPGDANNDPVIATHGGKDYVLSYEVNYKYSGSEMSKYLRNPSLRSIGTFSTYYELPEGVGTSNATCCGVLGTDTSSRDKPLDYRGRWDWYLSRDLEGQRRFNLITTDRPDVVEDYLRSVGLRNTTKIQ